MLALALFVWNVHAQSAQTTERCGVGSGVGVCDYIGDRGSQNVHVRCEDNKISIVNAQFGPADYPVQCGDYAAGVCNGQSTCTIDFSNDNCEAASVLPAEITEQVVMVSCTQ